MNESDQWRHMSIAPRDGTRILVTVRPVEQGPADVDVVYWARADQFGIEGWRAADSAPGAIFSYADPELKCWMPLPNASAEKPYLPSPFEGEDIQMDGSGI
ncbi:MAG: hypothetical protein H0T56_10565 [Pseudaminobacter sp.]|nr:hypothetical protein [Pseudaminobacter sp.]